MKVYDIPGAIPKLNVGVSHLFYDSNILKDYSIK